MRVLITGASGLVGSNLSARMVREGHEVLVHGQGGKQTLNDATTEVRGEDIDDIDMNAIGNIDALFHQAAITDTSLTDETEMLRVNAHAPLRLFIAAAKHGCRTIVYASSTAVYGNLPAPYREDGPVAPLNAYARSKVLLDSLASEFAASHKDTRVVGLRYCNVYGPGESHKGHMASMVYRLAQQMQQGNPKLFKYGEQKREYIYVDDVVEANVRALLAQESCILNCTTGVPRTFNDLVAILNTALGLTRVPEYIENPFEGVYQSHIECDVSRMREVLGFSARFSLEDGIKAYAQSGLLIA